jgi:type IV pilus assembly protein PilC
MPQSTFTYKVRDAEGKLIEGQLEGDNLNVVATRLRQMGYTPIRIDEKQVKAMQKDLKIPGLGNKVKLKEIAVFSRQFATLINSGLSLLRSLTILGEQTVSPKLTETIGDLRAQVERGTALSQALAQHPKVFNRLYLAMVRAGETSGNLDSALESLANTIEKQVALRGKIKSAMAYPAAVLSLVCLILAAMLLFIVPVFKKIYGELNGKLPAPTQLLINLSNVAVYLVPACIVAAPIAFVLFKRALQRDDVRIVYDRLKMRIPIIGQVLQKTALSRFASTLSSLLRSGVPVLESLEITNESANNLVVSRGVEAIDAGIRRGEPMTRALVDHPVFPPMVAQMMAIGEETGNLDNMLAKIASFLDDEIERTIDALTSLLEPLLIVVMGSVVGSMVVALYLPMFNVTKLVNGG